LKLAESGVSLLYFLAKWKGAALNSGRKLVFLLASCKAFPVPPWLRCPAWFQAELFKASLASC